MKVSLLNQNALKIQFPYTVVRKDMVKGLAGAKFDRDNKWWTIPIENSATAIEVLKAGGFEVQAEVFTALAGLEGLKNDLNALQNAETADFATTLPLLPYQKAGAAFLARLGSGILGDDVGLGKTIQTLAVIESKPETKKILVFCPSVLKYQWQAEINKFLGGNLAGNDGSEAMAYKYVQVIEGTAAQRAKQWNDEWPYKFYIANYELLLRDFNYMNRTEWDYIVADEATKISNPRAQTSRAIKKLRARFRLALTGTLISNRPDDCWNIVDFTNPGVLGSWSSFMDKYSFRDTMTGIFLYHDLDQLANKLKRYMIRRMKVNVLKELPAKRIIDVPFKLGGREKELYNQIRQELLFEISKLDISKISPMTIQMTIVKMLRLRQLTDSMELLGENVASTKLEVLKELLKEMEDRKVIIFTEFKEMAKILQREVGGLVISGDNSDNIARRNIVEEFNTKPEHKILIMTSAGQFGLNIQAASVIIHYDQPWSLAKLTQREGRAWRFGQKQNVMCYNLLGKGTFDMYMQRKLFKKQEVSGQLLGDPVPSINELKEMLLYEE